MIVIKTRGSVATNLKVTVLLTWEFDSTVSYVLPIKPNFGFKDYKYSSIFPLFSGNLSGTVTQRNIDNVCVIFSEHAIGSVNLDLVCQIFLWQGFCHHYSDHDFSREMGISEHLMCLDRGQEQGQERTNIICTDCWLVKTNVCLCYSSSCAARSLVCLSPN